MRTTIARSRPEVFRTIADPRTYPSWLLGAQRIRHVDRSFPAPSAEFEHSVGPTSAATVDDSSEVLTSDPPRRLGLEVHAGPLQAEVTFELDESPGGTVVTFTERATGRAAVVAPVLRPLLHLRNVWSLRRLRHLVEGMPDTGDLGTLA